MTIDQIEAERVKFNKIIHCNCQFAISEAERYRLFCLWLATKPDAKGSGNYETP